MARRLVDYGDLSINWTQLESASADAGLGVDAVTNERDAFERGAAATNECEGMEALRVLAEATRSFAPRGIRSRSQVSANELFSMLRVAYELEDLEKDSMFWSMRSWERANLSYPLLKGWRIRDPFGILLDQRYWELDLSVLLGGMTESQQLVAAKMDLDGFKQVNDLLGHSKGDDALRLYSRIIEQIFGRVGEVYRRGGDEVVALAIGLDQAAGKVLAEEARLGVEAAMAAWGEPLGLPACPTLSVGVVWIQGKRTLEEVSRLLDEAQMEAKGKGKNCVVCRY
jgi:diguanylate cyclase (GGDEF)-like protein